MPSLVSDYDSQLKELTEYLKSDRQDVRLACAKMIKDLSADEAVKEWTLQNKWFLKRIIDLRHDHVEVVHSCLSALINLMGTRVELIDEFSKDEELLFDLLKMCIFPEAPLADLVSMFLANLSSSPKFCELLLKESPGSDTTSIEYLLDVFIKGSEGTWNRHARYDFLANVFANVTAHSEKGREFFLQPRRIVKIVSNDAENPLNSTVEVPQAQEIQLARILCFMAHPSIHRRGGVISIIKNVCFDSAHHHILLGDSSKIDLLPYLLLPLAGPEELTEEDMDGLPDELQFLESDKQRESDPNIRLFLVEALLLLAATRMGRDYLRAKKVYPIIRELDKSETSEKVKDIVYRLVNMIMRSEAQSTSVDSSKLLETAKRESKPDDFSGFEEI